MDNLTIRKFNLSELDQIKYLQPEGWDNIAAIFQFYHQQSFCYPVVAIVNDKIIGVANGILNEGTGWLSHIIVAKEYRGIGIGRQLTEHIMDFLSSNGCKTQLLIASELGEPVYRKLGFKTVNQYLFFKGPKLNEKLDDENIRPIQPSDFDSICKLDQEVTGEIRTHMLQQFFSNGWIYHDSRSRQLAGYFLPEMGEGLIIARDSEAGVALLKLKHSLKACKTVLPEENLSGRTFLIESGMTLFLSAKRMILGEEIPWQPQFIFSRMGGYYG